MNETLGLQRNNNNVTNNNACQGCCPMCSQEVASDQGNPAGLNLQNLPPQIAGFIQQLLQLAQQFSNPQQQQPQTQQPEMMV